MAGDEAPMLSGFLNHFSPGWAQPQRCRNSRLGSSIGEKLPPALWDVGSIWPLSTATSSSLLCACN